jgi:hypothetical protein
MSAVLTDSHGEHPKGADLKGWKQQVWMYVRTAAEFRQDTA